MFFILFVYVLFVCLWLTYVQFIIALTHWPHYCVAPYHNNVFRLWKPWFWASQHDVTLPQFLGWPSSTLCYKENLSISEFLWFLVYHSIHSWDWDTRIWFWSGVIFDLNSTFIWLEAIYNSLMQLGVECGDFTLYILNPHDFIFNMMASWIMMALDSKLWCVRNSTN